MFGLTCKDAGGHVSNMARLTYTGVANAVNFGDRSGDVNFGIWPSGFGNVAGAKVLLSTGMNRSATRNSYNITSNFTNQVTWQNADINRPGAITNLELVNMSNARMYKLVFSGDLTVPAGLGAGCVACFNTSSGVAYSNSVIDDVHEYFSPSLIGTAITYGFRTPGCTGRQINNSSVDYINSGLSLDGGTSGTINNLSIRHFYVNAGQAGNIAGWTINDLKISAPMIDDVALHADYFQVSNGASGENLHFNRTMFAQADGVGPSQGLPFGGGGLAGNVYVDDGTGTHGPGKVATISTGVFQSGGSSAHIYITSGNAIPIGDNIAMTCSGGSCLNKTQATLSLASDVNIGSPGSPVPMYVATNTNLQINAYASSLSEPNGTFLNGSAGTSFIKNVTAVQHSPTTFSETQFTGTISGNQLTAAGPITNNIAGTVRPPLGAQQTLRYSGCSGDPTGALYKTACGVISTQATRPYMGSGTYTLSSSPGNIGPVTMNASFAFPLTAGTVNTFRPGSCSNSDLNLGTMTIDGVYYQGGTSGSPCPPANCTTTNAFYGQSSMTGADFASGVLPQVTLEAIPRSTWAAMTDSQVLTQMCKAMPPKAGGKFDAGGGLWYGAFTGTGEWNDGSGTAITGCGIH